MGKENEWGDLAWRILLLFYSRPRDSWSYSLFLLVRRFSSLLEELSSQWIQPAVLFGILETGEECTLLEPVVLPRSTPIRYRQQNGGSTVVSGEVGYKYLVVGKHLELHGAA